MLLPIAWRNLWRSPRRTIILLLAVAGGLTAMLANYGILRATSDRMLEAITGSSLGHVQIHHEAYRTQRGSDRTVEDAAGVLEAVRGTEGVEAAAGRIYGFAHVAFVRGEDDEVRAGGGEDVGSPVTGLLGVDPVDEGRVTDLPTRVVEGRWLEGETDVVLGRDLARRNHVRLGDAFLPSAVDRSGALRGPWAVSDEVPRVVGIVRTGVEQIDGRMAFVSRAYLERLLRMEDEVHEVAIRGESAEGLDALAARIERSVGAFRETAHVEEQAVATVPLTLSPSGATPSPDASVPSASVRLVGVSPAASDEDAASRAAGLERGRYLVRSEEIVLGERAAAALGVGPGDRVEAAVPVDCGEGVPAEGCPPALEVFVVVGVLPAGATPLGGEGALVSRQVVEGNVAALSPASVAALGGEAADEVSALAARLHGEGGDGDEVLPWYEIAPEVREMLAMMDAAPLIFFMILYLAVILGIVNSMLMATYERTREIGLMRAMGMRPGKVVAMVLAESALLALIGVAVGAALGVGIVASWAANGLDLSGVMQEGEELSMLGVSFDPVLWPRLAVADVVRTGLAVGALTTLAGLWPAVRAARLQPVEALRRE